MDGGGGGRRWRGGGRGKLWLWERLDDFDGWLILFNFR